MIYPTCGTLPVEVHPRFGDRVFEIRVGSHARRNGFGSHLCGLEEDEKTVLSVPVENRLLVSSTVHLDDSYVVVVEGSRVGGFVVDFNVGHVHNRSTRRHIIRHVRRRRLRGRHVMTLL